MKSQSLPMYAIAVIIIGLIVLAVFLLYSFGVFSDTHNIFTKWFGYGTSKSQEASQTAGSIAGS